MKINSTVTLITWFATVYLGVMMRMSALNSKYSSTMLILLMFASMMTFVPPVYLNANLDSSYENEFLSSPPIDNQDSMIPKEDQIRKINDYSITENKVANQGVFDPVTVEQSGYAASENLSARTDTYENLVYDLPLDSVHNWVADEAEVIVWDLEKLYAVNGTFSEGIPGYTVNPSGTLQYYPLGWSATSYNADPGQTQQVSYEQGGDRYVTVQNTAKLTNLGQNQYTHYGGTNVTWFQTFENAPFTSEFLLQFNYLMLQGPLSALFSGDYSLVVMIDESVVSTIDLPTLSNRGQWYNSGIVPVNISSPGEFMTLNIGIVINANFVTDADLDYDGDGSPDGAINTQFITVYLDDISLIKATPPTPEQVQLQFATGGQITPLSGILDQYAASITNTSLWSTGPVSVSISSNTSVSFNYKTRLFNHRFTNSNWEPKIASIGVSYTIDHGNSSDLALYTYVGYLGNYEDPQMEIFFPRDWANVTVSDPFLTVQTGECSISDGHLIVPSSLIINYLGWWEIQFNSPNYAKSIVIQKETAPSIWVEDTIYRVGNTTRTQVIIGTIINTPATLDNVNITWSLPDGGEWTTESLSGGVTGLVTGTPHVLTSGLSPAGEWCVEIIWTNGTEIAYDIASFEVHHSANLIGDPALIETNAGLVVTAIVRYTDNDTSAYIMDDLATISGNWSLSTVYFDANPVKNWWEVSLNTENIGAGNFIILVDASRPYYDSTSCEIQIVSTNVTRLNSPNAPWSSTKWSSEISLTFNFEVYDSGTDVWGPVTNKSDVSVNINWTAGYWNVIEGITPGIYIINLDTSAHSSGTYLLETVFEKPKHQSKQLFLTLIVSPIASSLTVIGDSSARVDISDDYSLKLKFSDQAAIPIPSASVVVDSVSPVTGLSFTTVDEVSGEPGNYSVTLTPTMAGVYAIRFVATETNSEPGSTVFVLVVNDVATSLFVPGGDSFEIGLTDKFNTTFTFETFDFTGIESASISILYSGTPGGISWNYVEKGLGEYSVEFSASISGTYVVTIAAFKQYYQSASDSFFLVVLDISTNLSILNGTAGIVSYGKNYNMVLSYTNGSGFGLAGADIAVESVVPETGLSWGSVIPGAPGIYSLLLTPETTNTFTILVRASLLNHQIQFARFTITATAIASSLTVLNSSTTISFDQNYTVYVYYQSEDFVGLENASISIQNPPAEVEYTEFQELGSGYYRVTLNPHEIGTFDFVFRAELTGYQSDTAGFALSASRIQTDLRIASGLYSATIEYLQTSEVAVIFERTDFNQTVSNAAISIQMNPSTGLEWSFHEESGVYYIQVEPSHIGRWTLTITASKVGYALDSVQFILDVESIRIEAELLSNTFATEGVPFLIEISLTHEGTTIPVTGALVEYRMSAVGAPVGNFEVMEETDAPGVYRVSFTFPLYQSTGEYELEIQVTKDNYELIGGSFSARFSKSEDFVLRAVPVATGSGLLAVILIGSVIGLRINNTRKKRKNLEALQVKKRFDDVSNILGIIVLHKKSGLPVFSKMIKGGFEEAMVSAFITAITHFRSEFEMDEKHWEFNVIPISDIISTVPTKSLIVAFITVRPPSQFQEVGMQAFGRATGAMFDEILAEQKSTTVDNEQTKILDTLFYDLLDGFLIERFRTNKDVSFPKNMRCLETAAHQLENGEGFKLEDLAKGMASCGIEESRAYKIVMDAIDEDLIEIADEEKTDVISGPFTDHFTQEHDEHSESE